MDNQTYALATMLVGLAILQGNGVTYVNREIAEVIERLKLELAL